MKALTIEEFAEHIEKKNNMKLTIDFTYEDIKGLRKKLCNYELTDEEVITQATKEAFRAYMQ